MSRQVSPIELLRSLEAKNLGNQLVEAPRNPEGTWRSFVFRVGELDFAMPFTGGTEIAVFRNLFPVPMAKSWVRGMTNIRGEIYTVIDLAEFMGLGRTRISNSCNLFLLPDAKLKSALLIDGRISLRSFSSDLPFDDAENFDPELAPFISGVVKDEAARWGILDVTAISRSERFVQIGI